MPKIKDLTGLRFNRLLVIKFLGRDKYSHWLCKCDCGTEKSLRSADLCSGQVQSCGCLRRDTSRAMLTTHGLRLKRKGGIYESWAGARYRCKNSKAERFHQYGGRGIRVCDQWSTFAGFYADMGPTWFKGATLERKDNNGNYEPSNCIWITKAEQPKNRSTSVFIDTPWGRLNAADVARKLGINHATLHIRMKRWPKERWLESKH